MQQKILAELDALVDTRMGTIIQLSPEEAIRLMTSGEYYSRTMDEFGCEAFTQEQYVERYRTRDIYTLQHSLCAQVMKLLHHMVNQLELMAIYTPFVERVKLEVNTYPYELPTDVKEAYVQAIEAYTGPTTKVEMVHYSPEDLSPRNIRTHEWTGLILYDFDNWFTLHGERLPNCPLHDITFITPALYVKKPNPEDLLIDGKPGPSPFALTEQSLSEFLTLIYVDPRDFCVMPRETA